MRAWDNLTGILLGFRLFLQGTDSNPVEVVYEFHSVRWILREKNCCLSHIKTRSLTVSYGLPSVSLGVLGLPWPKNA